LYKKLFCHEERLPISLGENFWDFLDLLTIEEWDGLDKPFSEDEIRDVVFVSYACGAPGPDGFSFTTKIWFVIKDDFMALVHELRGTLDIRRINYSIITLIPNEPYA
jgi:hypothetical protein